MAKKGEGKAYRWILAHADYAHADWCLIWPFSRDKHGRGMLNFEGETWAHRCMCKKAHGEPPTPKHTAAHTCGCGHDGCVNPLHLAWKTQAENLEDCRAHGTLVRHHGGNVRRLLPEQVRAIKEARGFQTQGILAARFNVSEGTISDIWHGRSHTNPSKIPHWNDEELAKLREGISLGLTFSRLACHVGTKTPGSVASKMRRMGLRSARAHSVLL